MDQRDAGDRLIETSPKMALPVLACPSQERSFDRTSSTAMAPAPNCAWSALRPKSGMLHHDIATLANRSPISVRSAQSRRGLPD
jgi:hypothetical protein